MVYIEVFPKGKGSMAMRDIYTEYKNTQIYIRKKFQCQDQGSTRRNTDRVIPSRSFLQVLRYNVTGPNSIQDKDNFCFKKSLKTLTNNSDVKISLFNSQLNREVWVSRAMPP